MEQLNELSCNSKSELFATLISSVVKLSISFAGVILGIIYFNFSTAQKIGSYSSLICICIFFSLYYLNEVSMQFNIKTIYFDSQKLFVYDKNKILLEEIDLKNVELKRFFISRIYAIIDVSQNRKYYFVANSKDEPNFSLNWEEYPIISQFRDIIRKHKK